MPMFAIISDILHGGGSKKKKKQKTERYHYTNNNIFEQSLDIYRPVASSTDTNKDNSVVALVVGSAWLGHRAFVYSPTSWWNSAGPKSISDLGYVCICIRHRGAFMQTFNILTLTYIIINAFLIMAMVNASLPWLSEWEAMSLMKESIPQEEVVLLILFITGLLLMQLGGIGAASFDEMQNDVLTALKWLKANEDRIGVKCSSASREESKSSNQSQFIFGGYSSGGHVAATLAQNANLWKDHDLPPPQIHCDSLLFISPVLATKAYHDVLIKKMSSLSSSSSLPSLSPSETGSSEHDAPSRQSSSISEALSTQPKPPTWLTDQVVKAVFGRTVASSIPSPIHTYEKSSVLPHIFVGCENEMFGLPWLNTFFCSSNFSELLTSMGIESRYTAVQSDHWNILNSDGLREHLRKELKRVGGEKVE